MFLGIGRIGHELRSKRQGSGNKNTRERNNGGRINKEKGNNALLWYFLFILNNVNCIEEASIEK